MYIYLHIVFFFERPTDTWDAHSHIPRNNNYQFYVPFLFSFGIAILNAYLLCSYSHFFFCPYNFLFVLQVVSFLFPRKLVNIRNWIYFAQDEKDYERRVRKNMCACTFYILYYILFGKIKPAFVFHIESHVKSLCRSYIHWMDELATFFSWASFKRTINQV